MNNDFTTYYVTIPEQAEVTCEIKVPDSYAKRGMAKEWITREIGDLIIWDCREVAQ